MKSESNKTLDRMPRSAGSRIGLGASQPVDSAYSTEKPTSKVRQRGGQSLSPRLRFTRLLEQPFHGGPSGAVARSQGSLDPGVSLRIGFECP